MKKYVPNTAPRAFKPKSTYRFFLIWVAQQPVLTGRVEHQFIRIELHGRCQLEGLTLVVCIVDLSNLGICEHQLW